MVAPPFPAGGAPGAPGVARPGGWPRREAERHPRARAWQARLGPGAPREEVESVRARHAAPAPATTKREAWVGTNGLSSNGRAKVQGGYRQETRFSIRRE